MSVCDWASVPSVVLIHLYQYLPLNDRIRASSVCQHWRETFWFYPSWRKLHLNANRCSAEKNEFLVKKYSKTCRSLSIAWEDIENVSDILGNWTVHPLISEFQLQKLGSDDHAIAETWESAVYPFIEKCFVLIELVLSHVGNLKRLASALDQNASTIKYLAIGKMLNDKCENEVSISSLLSPLVNISILQLDCSWLTDEVLLVLVHLPLQRFIITMHESSSISPISENSWNTFKSQLRRCELRVTCCRLMSPDLSVSQKDFLSEAAIATHVRFFYCSHRFQEACINVLMKERVTTHTIRTIWAIMDPKYKNEILLPHPFVVCAWRFKHLRELVLSGAPFDKYDLEGMARMRPGLRVQIAKEDIIWELNSEPRRLTTSELNVLAKALKPSKGDVWLPMDERRFNDLSLPYLEREALVLRQLYLEDFKTN